MAIIASTSLGSIFGENWTLKTYGSKTMSFNNDMQMHVASAGWSKMYKRSMFNISAQLDGINSWFSSCYSPNIFDVSLTVNAEGLKFGDYGLFQVDEFLDPIEHFFTTNVINRILNPQDIMLVSHTSSGDEDGETTIVNDLGYVDTYQKTSFNRSKTYRVYFPKVTQGGSGDSSVDQKDDIVDVINQSKLYAISLSCQDKIYTLKATALV